MKTRTLLALLGLALTLVLATASSAAGEEGACGAEECIGTTPVVPSLDPDWSAAFVVPQQTPALKAAAACIETNIVVYAPTDWVRFAQKMRANMSPCASYYVSIPPVAADKTKPRGPNQAPLIRALGPNFHAVNEVNVTASTSWSKWVADGNGTWYDAGILARHRMEDPQAGGFDVSAGDTWALNELTSAVRQGTGPSRANMREFVHGLYDGDSGIPVKGIVWTSGISQGTTFLDTYRANVKNWLGDTDFWSDMSKFVQFFSQETYGRVDAWAVAGTSPQDRLEPTADYLEHYANFAAGGAYDAADAGATYLATADAPIGNAAWSSATYEWPSPAVDHVLAANYDAAQVYAFRHEQAARPSQAFGFAWSPANPGLTTSDFNTKTAFILDRIAASIHASDLPSDEPGLAACGTDLSWCAGDLAGSAFNTPWRNFHDWSAPSATPWNDIAEEGVANGIPLAASDPDPGQQLSYTIVTQPAHGTATTDGASAATYVPEAGYGGPDSFTFRASDGWLSSKATTVDVTVYGLPEGGAFVVGDRSAAGDVMFWSPSWWLANALSGGPAPASFKGFATRDGVEWVGSTGFDHAPAVVPTWMGVLVASSVERNGGAITVTPATMAVVRPDGYDPRLVGRGTVVATGH
jgi:hypothetical protein